MRSTLDQSELPVDQPPTRDALALVADSPSLDQGKRLGEICAGLHAGPEIIAAALLYPSVRAGKLDTESVRAQCGTLPAQLIENLLEIAELETSGVATGSESGSRENLRKLLLALAQDVRAVLLRLALQLDAMRHATQERTELALATRNIWAPLANRLGIWQLKWELEDFAFRELEPDTYHRIADWLKVRRSEREQLIESAIQRLRKALDAAGLRNAEISGRPKHLYSIWRKMQRKHIDILQVRDIHALRVLMDSVADCYAALGIVHGMWQHIPGEFDDYITQPKRNNYRSLHTAVVGPGSVPIEIQIRTHEMHESAELGVASHWRYKEGARFDPTFEQRLAWLRRLLEPVEGSGDDDLLERLRLELSEERVYALTPQGRIIDLPSGATVLDFAYYVHTELGHRCRGARINGHIAPLTTQVRNGDRVEIVTTREGGPSRDWLLPQLGFLQSSRARDKVRAWFRRQDHAGNVESGKQVLERELSRLNLRDVDLEALCRELKQARIEDLYASLGAGDISLVQAANAVGRMYGHTDAAPARAPRTAPHAPVHEDAVRIEGVGGLLTQLSNCCKPAPGDAIAGYVTRGRGVSIHRRDCHNLLRLAELYPERVLDVNWSGDAGEQRFPVNVQVVAWDRRTLLQDITAVLANDRLGIRQVHMDTDHDRNAARLDLVFEVDDIGQLSRVLNRIARLPNVISARRS